MQSDNEQLQADFHNKADAIFFRLIGAFEAAVKTIDRQMEEYRFQQQKETFCKTLQQELESCASQLVQQNSRNQNQQDLSQNLQHFIKEYLHLFVQKTRAL